MTNRSKEFEWKANVYKTGDKTENNVLPDQQDNDKNTIFESINI